MIKFSVQEMAGIVHGRYVGVDSVAAGQVLSYCVVTDSREAVEGALFVAKPGECSDGHFYIGEAFERGAALVLAEREVRNKEGLLFPSIIVPDVVVALGQLAKAHLQSLRAAASDSGEAIGVLAVTGSVGKTTVKDLVMCILRTKAATVAPIGSYNGEVGVPLTVCSASEGTRFLVIEMGATKPGNISYLCDIVEPDSAAVLNVGTAHVGEFGGRHNIAKAKAEIICDIPEYGYAVLNVDDTQVQAMMEGTRARVFGFSVQYGSAAAKGEGQVRQSRLAGPRLIYASEISIDALGRLQGVVHFPARTIDECEAAIAEGEELQPVSFRIKTSLVGLHHMANVLAAASLAYVQGITADDIAAALENRGAASRYRMERIVRDDGVVIINDAYNASPESMRAALQTLAIIGHDAQQQGRRTWAVLGAMLELGQDSAIEHDTIGRLVVRLNISRLVVVGENARAMYVAAVMEGSWSDEAIFVSTMEEAEKILQRELMPGDVVLFKSSHDNGLRLLGDRIANGSSDA